MARTDQERHPGREDHHLRGVEPDRQEVVDFEVDRRPVLDRARDAEPEGNRDDEEADPEGGAAPRGLEQSRLRSFVVRRTAGDRGALDEGVLAHAVTVSPSISPITSLSRNDAAGRTATTVP